MRELAGGKNTIGQMAAVLKKPHKATFNLFFKTQFQQMVGHKVTLNSRILTTKKSQTCKHMIIPDA